MHDDILFHGIIEGQGRVISLNTDGAVNILEIDAASFNGQFYSGDQVAVDGVCLTVQAVRHSVITFHLWPVTIEKSNLGNLSPDKMVNLERNCYLQEPTSKP